MSVKFHRTEIVTRNARQLAIGGMLILERSFSQAGIVITVAVLIHALHLVNSPTNSRVSDALPLTKLSIVLQKVIVDHRIESPTAEQDHWFVAPKTAKKVSKTINAKRRAIDSRSRTIGLQDHHTQTYRNDPSYD